MLLHTGSASPLINDGVVVSIRSNDLFMIQNFNYAIHTGSFHDATFK
jgi:hypothetical protein